MSFFEHEVRSQPAMWTRAAALAETCSLPGPGRQLAIVGCGTSSFMAQAAARAREGAGLGRTDAFPASQLPTGRRYDDVIAISRSGTTTEVLRATASCGAPVTAIVGVPNSPLAEVAAQSISLDFADERSFVQSRFATSALVLLLAAFGSDIGKLADEAAVALDAEVPAAALVATHFVFLGDGVGAAIASEAALKVREGLGAWSESYPTMEYRHGPMSAANSQSLVWVLDNSEPSIDSQIAQTGATVIRTGDDPLVALVRVHQMIASIAVARGTDIDHPPHLARSIVLD